MPYRTTSSANLTHKGKTPPPEETMQEAAYLKMLGEKQKPVSIKLRDGEIVRGWVEYYDLHMVRLTREDAPNLFIFKSEILYISEGGKESPRRTSRSKASNGTEAAPAE
ncbi:MAG TPA: Sm ribonucleo-like protein [Terriglobales bacterium]|nr:Sm ribonucleo-like protein [Terriglobales bacterium]